MDESPFFYEKKGLPYGFTILNVNPLSTLL